MNTLKAHRCRILALAAGMAICVWLIPQPASGQGTEPSAVRIIKDAIAVRWAASSPSWDTLYGPKTVAVDTIATKVGSALTVLRGRDWMDPDSPPLVAAVANDGSIFRLGGFPDPDPRGAASHVRRYHSPLSARDLADQLAVLLDPNGAVELVPWTPEVPIVPDELRANWEAHRPIGWPAPGTTSIHDGGTLVRVSVLTRARHLAGRPWQALAYTFQFDREGELGEWFVLAGPVLR